MTDVPLSSLHRPAIAPDEHGNYFVYCYACSHVAGDYVIECRQRKTDKPWPPFLLSEAPPQPRELTPDFIAELNAQFDPTTNEHTIREHMLEMLADHIINRPRSLQKEIGPSEIGHDCSRYIGYKLAEVEPMNPAARLPQWRPQIGVWGHAGLEGVINEYNAKLSVDRFLSERRIKVTEVPSLDGGTEDIKGTADLYDAVTATVVDAKFVGDNTMKKVKARVRTCYRCGGSKTCEHIGSIRGASDQYRIQDTSYGVGYAMLGLRVRWVAVAYFPVAGELHDAFFHVEPFNPDLPRQSYDRMVGIRGMLQTLPADDVLAMLPTADHYCQRCPFFNGFNPTKPTEGCPGHGERKLPTSHTRGILPPPLSDDIDSLKFGNADRTPSHMTRGVQ